MRYGKPLILSLIMHMTVAAFLVRVDPSRGAKGGKSSHEGSEGEGDSRKPIKIKVVTNQNGNILPVYRGPHGEPCKKWFGGIGITHEGDGHVSEVFSGYPAAKLGLQKGDYILDIDSLLGPVDTIVTFTYIRSGIFTTVAVKRGRICLGG